MRTVITLGGGTKNMMNDHTPNYRTAPNPAIAIGLLVERHRRGVGDSDCWTN